MLDNLPFEITLNILNRLEFTEKLCLAKTCRRLHDVVSKNGLYEEVNLGTGKKAVKIVNLFKNKKLDGAQVKRLSLDDIEEWSDELYDQFTDIFPNVTEFINPSGFSNFEEPRENDPLSKWADTIETIIMGIHHIQMVYMLEDGPFSRLKYLEISPYTDFADTDLMFSITILECIKHAPNLKELVVKEEELDIKFLEKLHNCNNSIESLTFDTILFNINGALPKKIKPATNIKHLELTPQVVIADTKGNLMDYIARKYTKLETLVLGSHFRESIIDYFIAHGHDMEEEGEYFDEHDESVAEDYAATRSVYSRGGASRLISLLPSTLKELKIDQELFADVEDALNKSNCNAKLTFIRQRRY